MKRHALLEEEGGALWPVLDYQAEPHGVRYPVKKFTPKELRLYLAANPGTHFHILDL